MCASRLRTSSIVLLLMLTSSNLASAGSNPIPPTADSVHAMAEASKVGQPDHLTPSSSIGEILEHRAFQGFGRLLLPWDDRTYDQGMQIAQFGALLPYHTHINPAVVSDGLNRLIDDSAKGQAVFYNFYTDQERREQPSRRNTGLFHFRGKPGAPFAIISPGGGFAYVGSLHEGFPYAAEISEQGYNAFVLKYRVGDGGVSATQDLAAALSYVVRNAERLQVSAHGYSLWGSSAGARMAAAIGSHGAAQYGGDRLAKPAAVIMAYTAHSDVSTDEPPTFVAVGERDGIAPPSVMETRVSALRRMGTAAEFHVYRNLGHGFGPGAGTDAEGWIGDAVRFWATFVGR